MTFKPNAEKVNTVLQIREMILYLTYGFFRIIGFIPISASNLHIRLALNTARAGYWSSKVGKMGNGVQIDSHVIIRGNPKNLSIDDFSYLDTNVQMEIFQPIRLGKYIHLADSVHLQSGDEIILGDYVGVAAGVKIYASSNSYQTPDGKEKNVLLSMSASAPPELQYIKYGKVIIEDFVFIGMNSIVLPGVKIGRGAIIGAGSLVNKDIPPYTIAIGVPARPVKERPIPDAKLVNFSNV